MSSSRAVSESVILSIELLVFLRNVKPCEAYLTFISGLASECEASFGVNMQPLKAYVPANRTETI
jgi:hypothetical protein